MFTRRLAAYLQRLWLTDAFRNKNSAFSYRRQFQRNASRNNAPPPPPIHGLILSRLFSFVRVVFTFVGKIRQFVYFGFRSEHIERHAEFLIIQQLLR